MAMYPDDLRSYLRLLAQAGQLAKIPAEVEPHLELATIVDLVSKGTGGGHGLLFERVRGATLPVAANLFGSPERVSLIFGAKGLDAVAQSIAADLQATVATDAQQALRTLINQPQWQPVLASRPICRSCDHSETGLQLLPPVVAWPGDGGPYLTLAQVYTCHPEDGTRNCGMYRIQIHDRHSATIRFRPGSGAASHLVAWHERGKAMPVAVALGGAPVLSWAASAPLPDGVDETLMCGYLLKAPLTMSLCQTSALLVPATAEIVIEGSIAPGDFRHEGPFGNHTGSYDSDAHAPVMRVLSVHARNEAIMPWTLVGPPPMENIQLMRATEMLLLPLVRLALPTLRGLHMPSEGIFHRAALITVDPSEERSLAELAEILSGTMLLRGSRLLVVGAADHEPHDPAAVFWRVLNRVDWSRDLLIVNGRLAVDARRLPAGESVRSDPSVLRKVQERWREYGLE